LALVIDTQDWLTNNRTIPIATATEIKRASATTGLIPEFFLPLDGHSVLRVGRWFMGVIEVRRYGEELDDIGS
jgi:hypothetical protein